MDVLPTERVALAALMLARGDALTVREMAQRLDITPRGARAMLEKMSRSVPLVDDGGVWRLLDDD